MPWTIEFSSDVVRQMKRLDPQVRQRIRCFIETRLKPADDPRLLGKALQGNLGGYWRWRVGNYRLVGTIERNRMIILIVRVAHRKDVY